MDRRALRTLVRCVDHAAARRRSDANSDQGRRAPTQATGQARKQEHGGPHYERLLSGGVLVLQLHHWETEHDHGRIGDPDAAVGNGVLVWFGDTPDFDGVVERAAGLNALIVRAPHRNPPLGEGNGPGLREVWIKDPDGYTVVVASPDGEAFEP